MRTAAERDSGGPARLGRSRALAVLAVYALLGAIYTYPALWKSSTGIANDPYDPILNTSILWWNATTLPFSPAWWNPPHFHPVEQVAAFTENLVGISVIASPVYWLTGSALTAYNFCFFASWPLCAFTAYLLAWFLVKRHDAAFLAGLIYGFTPYRSAEFGHLQMLSVYWLPLALLGLHGFITERRGWWLVLFGVAWVLQVLANGYYLFFGAVLIGLWLLYFCARPREWRALPAIVLAWVAASLVLAPVLWRYSTIHREFGLRRTMTEIVAFSAPAGAWFDVSKFVWFWHKWLPESQTNLFPGLTAILVVLVGALVALRWHWREAPTIGRGRGAAIVAAACALVISCAVMLRIVAWGPWNTSLFGSGAPMTELDQPINVALLSGLVLVVLLTPLRDALARRSVLLFYIVATILLAVFATGPQLRAGEAFVLEPMPYRLLMHLPGFDSIRVPTRFWMLGMLCLATAAGLAFARYGPARARSRQAVFALVMAGVLLDGWTFGIEMPDAPVQWPKVERRDRPESVIELPLGPPWDAAATFRAMRHRRPVVNGVSGYDPPHYAPLQAGLNAFDPAVLVAMATFGPLEIVVNGDSDPDGVWARYAASVAGEPILTDGTRHVYHVNQMSPPRVVLGPPIPIVAISGSAAGAEVVLDGRGNTEWHDAPQQLPGHWLAADIGGSHDVGGVTMGLGEFAWDFPRRLAVQTSSDGAIWETVWEGPTASLAMLGAIEGPRETSIRFRFSPRPARFVRLMSLASHKNLWRVAEFRVHAPAP